MATLYLLGTGAALSDPHRTTTMLAFEHQASLIVVDCGGDVVQRLMAAQAKLGALQALIVTHEHPDHVSGFPLFMEKIWLAGRREPLPVYGIKPALEQARRTLETFNTSDWEGFPTVDWREVKHEERAVVLEDDNWTIHASPGKHSVPVIGLRLEAKGCGTVAYSCDTEASDAITRLAEGADILVHEATGGFPSHSSAEDAARAAQRAGVKRLLLVHLPPATNLTEADIERTRAIFENSDKGDEGGLYEF